MKTKNILKLIAIVGGIALFCGSLGFVMPGNRTAFLRPVQSVYDAGNNVIYLPLILNGYPPNSEQPAASPTRTPSPTQTPSPTKTQVQTSTPTLSPTPTFTPSPTVNVPPSPTPTPIPVRTNFEFGMQMESFAPNKITLAAAANANWVGGISIPWKDVETSLGVRNWGALSYQESSLRAVATNGMTPIVVIRYTPGWAQLYSGYSCGPMKSQYFNAFASFVHDVVVRYSVSPYNVKYWEIWNEPDIDHNLNIAPDSPFGCWGDSSDTYYGGGYFADMLKQVYPAIKSADSNAKVLVGGLVLDCDPRPSQGCSQTGRDAKPPKFFEGILKNGGGDFFDGVSIHAYDSWVPVTTSYNNPNWESSSTTTGPVLIKKVEYIRSILSANSVSGKFLVNTETGMVSWNCTPWPTLNATRETEKSYMIAETLASAIANGLSGNLWFSLEGSWNCTGLINPDFTTLPAYTAYQFSSAELRGSPYVRDITDYANVKGYEFNRGDRRIWVLWSLDGNSHTISLPGTPLAIHHVNGASITPATSITITLEPFYFEWNP